MSKDPWILPALPSFDFADVNKLGEKQAGAFREMQRELWNLVGEANRNWLARAELERDLASDLAKKLSAAKTLLDAAKAYQEWTSRHMQAMADDNRKLVADSQRLMGAATRFFSSGEGTSNTK